MAKAAQRRKGKKGKPGTSSNVPSSCKEEAKKEAVDSSSSWRRDFKLLMLLVLLAVIRWWPKQKGGSSRGSDDLSSTVVSTEALIAERRFAVPCSQTRASVCKTDTMAASLNSCDRIVFDNFLSEGEVAVLLHIAEKGMAQGDEGKTTGPTIMDVNSGWVLAPGAPQPKSIYRNQASGGPSLFTGEEYDVYRAATARLKRLVEAKFGVKNLFFTAPTFITREVGDASWEPSTMHDEYWHPHVDKNNTAHYDYSGLVYLSTQQPGLGGQKSVTRKHESSELVAGDFTGGTLQFFRHEALDCQSFEAETGPCVVEGSPDLEVAPVAGRAIIFGSGIENPHRVTRVATGTRYVLSFWFTCNPTMEMSSFLDGKMHVHFETVGKESKQKKKETGL